MSDAHHPIELVSRITGLSMHLIRIWEQRYQAVEPQRTPTNRRLYAQSHIERLNLLREVTQAGYKISHVARLPMETLVKLAAESAAGSDRAAPSATDAPPPSSLLDDCVVAIRALDAAALDEVFKRASTALGALGLLLHLIAPLSQALGEMWRAGEITAAHEHFATAVIRVALGQAAKSFGVHEHAPLLLVATPAGQIHELGALLVAATAVNFGWRVTYLGASLPAAELAGAAQLSRARAVALSLVYPEDDPQLAAELERLRDALPAETALLVGGRAMPAYRDVLENVGAVTVENLAHLGERLDNLRKPSNPTTARPRDERTQPANRTLAAMPPNWRACAVSPAPSQP
ncbi:MAG: MerR family transcriptional regulator [Verrucomicrobiota bacterium]